MSAEQTVRIDGAGSSPMAITGPSGSAVVVAQTAPSADSAPPAGTILAASVTGDQTLFSMTGGQIWYGYFELSGSLTGAGNTALVTVDNLGGTATPDSSINLLTMTLSTGTNTDAVTSTTRSNYGYIYAGASDNDVHVSVTGDPADISAIAYGYLLT
jgi:hypothetical protein